MHILITGANGFIGRHLAAALRDAGHRVTACVRCPDGSLPPGIERIHADFSRDLTPQAWLPRLAGVDMVINSVGVIRETRGNTFDVLHHRAPVALFEAAAEAGVERVIQVSALGADPEAASEFHRSKGRADARLLALPVQGMVLLPSVVYGPGGQSTALFEAMAALPLVPLVGEGKQVIQPVDVRDLARGVVRLVDMDTPPGRVEGVGPEPVTLMEFLATFRTGLGLPEARFLKIPRPLVGVGAWLGDLFGSGPLTGEALGMLERGNTADPAPFAKLLGGPPTPLPEGVASQDQPQARLRNARLYFITPLLRVCIAAVWLVAAVVSAFVWPVARSYELLGQVGIPEAGRPLALYGASALDAVIGLAVLAGVRPWLVGSLQLAVIAAYTAIITLWLPWMWADPFGPLVKNLPLAGAILVWMVLEET